MKQIVGAIKTAFPDVVFTADDVISEDDRVAARFTIRGTQVGDFMGVPPTNKPIVVTGIDIVRFEGGKAMEHWHEWSAWSCCNSSAFWACLSGGETPYLPICAVPVWGSQR